MDRATRFLIAIYLTIGSALIAAAARFAYLDALRAPVAVVDPSVLGEPGFTEIAVLAVFAVLSFATAYGLWKRWRLVRLVLLGLCWYEFVGTTIAGVVTFSHSRSYALACLAGLATDLALLRSDPANRHLAPLWGLLMFAALQYWLLSPPACSRHPDARPPDDDNEEPAAGRLDNSD